MMGIPARTLCNSARFYSLLSITRSGTTLMTRYLDSHPDILCPGEVDMNFAYLPDECEPKVVILKNVAITLNNSYPILFGPNRVECGRIILLRKCSSIIYSTLKILEKRKGGCDPIAQAVNRVIAERRTLNDSITHSDLVIHYEEMVADIDSLMRKICTYVKVDYYPPALCESKLRVPDHMRRTPGDKRAQESTKIGDITVIPPAIVTRILDYMPNYNAVIKELECNYLT